jgi:hypothetical protein
MYLLSYEQKRSRQVPSSKGGISFGEFGRPELLRLMRNQDLLDDVEYAMLEHLAKIKRQKPREYLKSLIRQNYDKQK